MHVDFVGLGREVVLVARERVADRGDRLTALLERGELLRELLELAQARAAQVVEIEHHTLDPAVGARGAQRVDHVAQRRLLDPGAASARERALERIAGELIDERALRRDHERGPARDEHALAEQARDHDQQQEEQEQ